MDRQCQLHPVPSADETKYDDGDDGHRGGREGFPLADVLHSWKSFTSRKAGKLVGRSGQFWQREYLDRYVRNAEHYQAVVAYIEENPVKAGLAKVKTEWPWSSARFRATLGSAGVPPAS